MLLAHLVTVFMSHQYNYYVRLADQCQHLRQVRRGLGEVGRQLLTPACFPAHRGVQGAPQRSIE